MCCDIATEREDHMKYDCVMVRDADGNEIALLETDGQAREFCRTNGITGANGEYIAYGVFDTETRSFEADDYSEL